MESDQAEIVHLLEQLRRELEDLGVRGLRAVGASRLAKLRLLREELERIGAGHFAGQLTALVQAIENDDRSAAAALLRSLTALRVFERLLTLGSASDQLHCLLAENENAPT